MKSINFLIVLFLFQSSLFAQSKKDLLMEIDSLKKDKTELMDTINSLKTDMSISKEYISQCQHNIQELEESLLKLQTKYDSIATGNEKEIETEVVYVKGVVCDESYGLDANIDMIVINDRHGDFKGYNIAIYTKTLNNDAYNIKCSGNVHLDKSSYMYKLVEAKIIRSTGEFNNMCAPGTHKKEVWRPIEMNLAE